MYQTPTPTSRSLSSHAQRLTKSLAIIVATGVIGALAGALLSHFLSPRWAAEVTIQIGQISMPLQGGGLTSRPIENQLTAIDRSNLPSFRLSVINDLGLPPPDSEARESKVIFDSLHASAARGPDLVNLQVSAYSRELADAALKAAVKEFSLPHQKEFQPAISDTKRELDNTSRKLSQAEQEYARTYESIRSSAVHGNAAANSSNVLLTTAALVNNTQMLQLQQYASQLQQAISPLLSYPTRVVGAPYVPTRPSTPSTPRVIAVGALLGMLAGAAFAARGVLQRLL